MNNKIGILGAGSWGTALAILAANNGGQALLWGHRPEHVSMLTAHRQNKQYLAGIPFPENLSVTSSLEEIAAFSDTILVAVPSPAFKETLSKFRVFAPDDVKIAWATKGFYPGSGALLHELVAELYSPATPVAILSGPTFAKEVAQGFPTAVTLASPDPSLLVQLTHIFHSERFRIYTSSDMIGVEVGGAVKNVLAIAAGIADGLGFGANTRAALITRGLTEMIRIGVRLGGHEETFMGLAGLGDLVLTCTDNQSRNRRLGLALGQGRGIDSAIREIGQEIEGIWAAKETHLLTKKYAVDMPITEQTYKVLYEGLEPLAAVRNLLNRELKPEHPIFR